MLRLAKLSVRATVAARSAMVVRAMSTAPSKVPAEQGTIPDIEGLAGRARQEAMYKKAYDEDLFDRDATAYFEEGTRENPIPILSVEGDRIVGVSLPDDAEIRWFTLKVGELAYDANTCNYFALKQVTKDEVDEWVAKAEKQVLGK